MKRVITIIILMCTYSLSAQDMKLSKVNELFEVTQMDAMIPIVVNTLVKQFKDKNTHIPESYWEQIKKSIDYDTFLTKTKRIYADNYTIEELGDLIATHKSGDLESYKKKNERVNTQIYQTSNEFGVEVVKQITKKIKEYKS